MVFRMRQPTHTRCVVCSKARK